MCVGGEQKTPLYLKFIKTNNNNLPDAALLSEMGYDLQKVLAGAVNV